MINYNSSHWILNIFLCDRVKINQTKKSQSICIKQLRIKIIWEVWEKKKKKKEKKIEESQTKKWNNKEINTLNMSLNCCLKAINKEKQGH